MGLDDDLADNGQAPSGQEAGNRHARTAHHPVNAINGFQHKTVTTKAYKLACNGSGRPDCYQALHKVAGTRESLVAA